MDGFMLEGPVMNLDQGWFFPPPLLTQFMADLDAAGISWAKGAPDELRRRVAVCAKSLLGLADRTVSLAQLIVDPCAGPDWYAVITGRMVTGPAGAPGEDQDLSCLRQMRMLVSGGLNSIDRLTPRFLSLVQLVETALGSAMQGQPASAVAAHACNWNSVTCPPDEFDEYVPLADSAGEIAARSPSGSNTESSIFGHRYMRNYKKVFPNICKVFPAACSGKKHLQLATALAEAYKITTPLTLAGATSLNFKLPKIIAAVDTVDLQTKSNDERLAAFSEADFDGSVTKASAITTGSATIGAENLHALHTDPNFVTLTKALEAMSAPGFDTHAAYKLCATSLSPIGLIFVGGGKIPGHPVWNKFTGIQTEACGREVLLITLSVDKQGLFQKSWSLDDVHKDLSRKAIKGIFGMGDGKATSIHYYSQLIKPCLEKREGAHILLLYAAYEKAPCGSILLDAQLMRYAEEPLALFFSFIGYVGKDAQSFRALWRGLTERAQVLDTFPSQMLVVQSLKKKLQKVGEMAFANASADMVSALTASYALLKRSSGFFRSGSSAQVALLEYDPMITELLNDLKRAEYGMGRMPGHAGTSDVFSALMGGASQDACVVPGNYALSLTSNKRPDPPGTKQDGVKDFSVHGASTAEHGVFFSEEGVVFGFTHVGLTNGKTLNVTGLCPGTLALSKYEHRRDLWHVCGFDCTGHPRPEGITDDDVIQLANVTPDEREKMKVVVAPVKRDKQPRSASPGKGKGGGKGGKGKGKGKKGRGGRASGFQRQR